MIFLNDIEKFIPFLEYDINLINQGLQKDNPTLIKFIEKDKDWLYFETYSFIDVINKYCFQPVPSNNGYFKEYIPKDRLILFKRIFLSDVERLPPYTIEYAHLEINIYSIERLYIRFFLNIYIKSLISTQSTEDIFKQLYHDWKFFLKEQRMPTKLIIYIPELFFQNRLEKLPVNFEIKQISSIQSIEKTGLTLNDSTEYFGRSGSFILFNTEILCNQNLLESARIEKRELYNDWDEKLKKLNELELSLLLGGIHYKNESIQVKLPWWFGNQRFKFNRSRETIGTSTVTDEILKILNKVHKKIIKLDIFNDKELKLVLHRYNLLHKRDYLYDMILDEFIILESIFTKGSIAEVSYRLSSNLAFFLAEDLDEFKEIQNCVKDFYNIRSKIAHGEDWTRRILREKFRSHLEIEDPNTPKKAIIEGIYHKLGDYIDKTIKNIIEMKYIKLTSGNSTNIMKHFKGTYFIERSNLVK